MAALGSILTFFAQEIYCHHCGFKEQQGEFFEEFCHFSASWER